MSFPAGMDLCTITYGAALSHLADDLRVLVRVSPTHDLVWTGTGQPLVGFTIEREAAPGEHADFDLPTTDQPGFIDTAGHPITGWAYDVEMVFYSPRANADPRTVRKTVQPVVGQVQVDLDLVPSAGDVPDPIVGPVPAVTSVDGYTGAVDLSARYITRAEYVGGAVTELGRDEDGQLVVVNELDDLGRVTQSTTLHRTDGQLVTVTETVTGVQTVTTTLVRNTAGALIRVERDVEDLING